MVARRVWLVGASALLLSLACGGHRQAHVAVLDPPRFDLKGYGKLALMTFTVENARGSLHALSTQKFAEWTLAAQPGIEILELGPADTVMSRVGEREFGRLSAKAVGEANHVPVVFVGHLKVSNVRPSGSLAGLTSPHFEGKITMEMSVQLISTESGGTLWRASSTTTESLGQVGMSGGLPYFSARDPDEAYGKVITYLVRQVTWDFRPTWR